jgi:hypothetical protein
MILSSYGSIARRFNNHATLRAGFFEVFSDFREEKRWKNAHLPKACAEKGEISC